MMKKIAKLVLYSSLIFLASCGPTILSVGLMDITAGDMVTSGVKYKLMEDKE